MNRAAYVMFVSLALACGRTRAPAPAVEPIAPTEFCQRFAAATCGSALRCYPAYMGTDVATCTAAETARCQDDVISVAALAALPAGRIGWNADQAQRCLDLLDGPCANMHLKGHSDFDPCRALWTGKVAPGASCVPRPSGWLGANESPSARRSSGAALDEECAAGVCSPCGRCPDAVPSQPSGEGEPCRGGGGSYYCAAGLWCTGLDPRSCSAPSALGGACAYTINIGWQKELVVACQLGLACITTPSGSNNGVCATPLGAGAPCDRIRECAAGLTCLSSGTCGSYRGPGEPCAPPQRERDVVYSIGGSDYLWTGEGGDCAAGLACVEGTCRDRPSRPGDPCDECPPAFSCTAGRCFGPHLVCDRGRCALIESGAACESSHVCPGDQFCSFGRCVPRLPNGAACWDGGSCVSGRCDYSTKVCVPLHDNDRCYADGACLSGVCSRLSRTCVAVCPAN